MEKDTFLSPPVKSSSIENGRKKLPRLKTNGPYVMKNYQREFTQKKGITPRSWTEN